MLFLALSFLAGIVVVQQFSELAGLVGWAGLALLVAGLGYLRCWRLMFFTTGLLWAMFFASLRMQDSLPAQFEGQHIQVEGEVLGLPQDDGGRVRFDFLLLKPEKIKVSKIRLSWYYPKQQIKAGQYWQFTVKLKRPHGRYNPGGFDYERWLFMQNIGATGYVRNQPAPRLVAKASALHSVDTVRQQIADKLDHLLGETESRGLIKALTIGDRHELSRKQWVVFRDTGTIHLLAISGLHIGLVSGLTFLLILKVSSLLAIRSPPRMAAIWAIAIAVFYAALAGFSLPTQRALLMLTIAMVAIIWQRNIRPFHTLAVALLAVLVVDPLAVLSAGFWLSFLAVLLIIYSLSGRLAKAGAWQSAIKIHGVTALGLSPVLLFYFQQVSMVAPLANAVSVPLISLLVVPLCLLGVVMLFVSPLLAAAIFDGVEVLLQGMSWVLAELAALPFASIMLPKPPFYAVLLALLGVFILFSPKGVPARWLGLVLLLPVIFRDIEKPESGEIHLTVLDVGQGLSVAVQTRHHFLLFDTGAKYSSKYDMGEAVIVPFLKYKAVSAIDVLVVSHGDNDHIGGVDSILAQLQVKKILTSVPQQLAQYTPVSCLAGQTWVWDQVEFEILSPPSVNQWRAENNNSCVLKISAKQMRVLLTGDIEDKAEKWLSRHVGGQLNSDVLVVPHHGSNTSSGSVFLNHVKPAIALIPAGYRNRFSFPHPPVLARYKEMHTRMFNTATEGAISVRLKNQRMSVESIRAKQRKYWNH